MANIRVDVNYTIKDGSEIVFRSPVDCSAITGLIVYYPAEDGNTTSQELALADAHGNNVGDIDHLFAENVVVKVILDVTHAMAFVQNADTNAYIEGTFVKTVNGAKPDENGNVVVEIPEGGGGGSGEPGADGFSPIANVTQTASGAVISITDKSGTTTASVLNGTNGKDGYTPVKGVDYFDGKDGAKGEKGDKGDTGAPGADGAKGDKGDTGAAGANGKDGVSATHSWNGTTLTITSASGTSSANLKGDKGDQGIQGIQGEPGADGAKGDKGDTGASGTSVTVKSVSESTADCGSNVVTFSDGKTITIKNGSKGSTGSKGDKGDTGATGSAGKDGKDYSFDPTVYGLPVLRLTGDISPIKVSKDNTVTLSYVYGERSGSCTLKGQGATSYKMAKAFVDAGKAGKFNYTIKFDTAFEAAEGWGVQKKYCLKANWIDHSHSRNVVSAKLWGAIVKSRSTANANLSGLVNGGAVDGFPIVIMLNGAFHGLYTFNIPKDGWMMGMVEDATKTQALLGANEHLTATQFKGESAGNDADFELEFVSDEDNADWVTPSLNRLINACINSWGGDLDTTVAQYLDWDSAIDYYIWVVICKGTDMVDKNYLLSTFDGTKWHFTAYDMDSTYGLSWDGSGLTRAVSNESFEECASTHRVFELIKRYKTNALKARYNELRSNILSETRICQYFENFAWAMPSPVLLEDVKLYPTILGSGVNGIDQIARWVRQRLEQVDKWVNALPAQETPVNPNPEVKTYAITNTLTNCATSNSNSTITEGTAYAATISASTGYTLDGATVSVKMGGADITASAYSNGKISISSVTGNIVVTITAVKIVSGYTNLVKTSTDTDGSVYNGTGYKDNARLSSSGGVSSSAQNGSVVTGFIPFKNTDIIRIKGATWSHRANEHFYFSLYNSSKSLITNGYTSAETYSTDANMRSQISVVYDATTGVTTISIVDPTSNTGILRAAAKQASYFRINAYGKGADLIVTVNQEIT